MSPSREVNMAQVSDVATQRCIYNPFEAALVLGIGHNRVRELVCDGKLRAMPGRNIKIPDAAIEEFLKNVSREAK